MRKFALAAAAVAVFATSQAVAWADGNSATVSVGDRVGAQVSDSDQFLANPAWLLAALGLAGIGYGISQATNSSTSP